MNNALKDILPDHHFYYGQSLPPLTRPYRYWYSKDGTSVQVDCPVAKAILPVRSGYAKEFGKELKPLNARVVRPYPRVSVGILGQLIEEMRTKYAVQEVAYQIVATGRANEPFRCERVGVGNAVSVQYDDAKLSEGEVIILDVHSHHRMSAYFSQTDVENWKDVRWYCVIGELNKAKPTMKLGLHAHGAWVKAPPAFMFEPPILRKTDNSIVCDSTSIVYESADEQGDASPRKLCTMEWDDQKGVGKSIGTQYNANALSREEK